MAKRLLLLDIYTDVARAPVEAALGVAGFTHLLKQELEDRWSGQLDISVVDPAATDVDDEIIRDTDGLVFSGSPFGVNDDRPEIARVGAAMTNAAELGKPIFGICFGLQLAAKLAGGRIEVNPEGIETAVARKIELNDAGRDHPMMAKRSASFDAVADHIDNIVELPDSAVVLASNRTCPVQAATIPLGNSEVWGVQYHPDMDIRAVELLLEYRRNELLEQKFVADSQQLDNMIEGVRYVISNPGDERAAWTLGYDRDVLDASHRLAELENWLHARVL